MSLIRNYYQEDGVLVVFENVFCYQIITKDVVNVMYKDGHGICLSHKFIEEFKKYLKLKGQPVIMIPKDDYDL